MQSLPSSKQKWYLMCGNEVARVNFQVFGFPRRRSFYFWYVYPLYVLAFVFYIST